MHRNIYADNDHYFVKKLIKFFNQFDEMVNNIRTHRSHKENIYNFDTISFVILSLIVLITDYNNFVKYSKSVLKDDKNKNIKIKMQKPYIKENALLLKIIIQKGNIIDNKTIINELTKKYVK